MRNRLFPKELISLNRSLIKPPQESNADFLNDFEDEMAEEKSHERPASNVGLTPQSAQEFINDFADEFEGDV